ncbi:MAG: polysaccharide pyruvyl transferase CsaB [Ruminococcaceae bacterium]|nr:polysaccharide pyruvyl transferase CsaB [Oscillospiraceae bacterium]
MKVIHLISGGDSGGARTHVHLLLKYLNQNIEARLVCFMDGPFAQDAAAMGIPTEVMSGNPLRSLPKLRRMIKDGGYDLIHCHGSRGNLMGALLRGSVHVPVITTVHSDPKLDYLGRPGAHLTYGTLNALALRRMDRYVGVSEAMRRLLISRGFEACRIQSIYNGVEFSESDEAPDRCVRSALLEKLGLPADESSVVVGIAARLHPVKDIPTLLRGFAAAYREQKNLRLLIAGDGQDKAQLLALAEELGIAEVTCFAGWLTDMRSFYRAIDVNTLTSRSETFPYALTEGAREHLPTVATRVGGIPALIVHGETGYLINPGDADALGGHLAALAADAELRRRLGDALFSKARDEFSAEATARRQLEIYESILRRRARERETGRCGVLICGAYGMKNAGDEAILEAIVSEMRSIDADMPVTVLSRRAGETAVAHGVNAIYTFDLPRILRTLRRSELYINGGGSLLQDVTSSRSLWYYLFTLRAAKRCGCKVMMYGCGVGPVRGRLNRRLAGKIVETCVDAVTLREENSLEELRSFGVKTPEMTVASDPALFLSPAPDGAVDALLRSLNMDPNGSYICFCLRRWAGIRDKLDLFAAAANYAWNVHGLHPVLLSVNPAQDDRVAEALRERITVPCTLVCRPMETPEMIGFIGRMRAVLAMRLHVLIFAASRAVPLAAVSYDPKVSAFLDYLDQTNYTEYGDLTNREQLFAMVDAAAEADRDALRDSTQRIMAIESRNGETARRLLGREITG